MTPCPLLAVSEKTVYSYVFKGIIPFIKIESNLRFRPEAIREWLQKKEFLCYELQDRFGRGRKR